MGKSLVGGYQRRTGREEWGGVSEGKGGDFLEQWRGSCSSEEVGLWVCVLELCVAVVCVWGVSVKMPTQHPARWNLRLKELEQSTGGSDGFRIHTHTQPATPP